MIFSGSEHKKKGCTEHRLFIFEFSQNPKILWPKQIVFTRKAVNSGMSEIALKFLLLREGHPFIYHPGFYWVLAVFENKPTKGFC
jgi:hypothetical protein